MIARLKTLFFYIVPAAGGLFVTYLYNVVDGIFVGQGVGAAALGAVNVAVPFITFVVALAAMFPMGGATIAAICLGKGDASGANKAFMTALAMTLAVSVLLMACGMLFSGPIVDLSGGSGLSTGMRQMAVEYLFCYSAFSVPMLTSNCLSVFVRNDGAPVLSFAGMCAGAVANVFLDWLFIFPLQGGVIGAAIASGLGQVCSMLVLLSHFWRRKGILRLQRVPIKPGLAWMTCQRGVPEAVSQLTTPVTALCFNLVLAARIGDIGVSTFSVLSFIFSLANVILSGVAQGLQPLWGLSYGRMDIKEIRWLFRAGLVINLALSILITAGLWLQAVPAVRVFSGDPRLIQSATAALPAFSLSFIPMGLSLVCTAFLYSTKRTHQSDLVALSRALFKAAAIFCIPVLFGTAAIWLAPFAAESLSLVLAAVICIRSRINLHRTARY